MLNVNLSYRKVTKQLLNTNLIIVDDFLLNPLRVLEYLYSNQPKTLWKHWQMPSNNGKYFIDKRHAITGQQSSDYNNHIYNILNNSSQRLLEPNTISSNFTRFIDRDFNDYSNCYWYPHVDDGYNALLYLNTNGCSGTNIYDYVHRDLYNDPEHYKPWRPKHKYKLIYNIESKFNRLVLFDGRLLHGMAVNNEKFFYTERINLATFFY